MVDLALVLQQPSARRPARPAAPSGRSGAAGSSSIRSRPRWRRLSSTCWRRYSGRPTGRQIAGPGRVKPGLGGDHQLVGVGVQRLADQLLGDERAVGVGRVDEVTPSSTARRSTRIASSWSLGGAPDAGAGQLHRAVAEATDRGLPPMSNVPLSATGCVVVLMRAPLQFESGSGNVVWVGQRCPTPDE